MLIWFSMWTLGGQNRLFIKNTGAAKATCHGQRRRAEITGMLHQNDI